MGTSGGGAGGAGGIVAWVRPGSIAAQLGLRPGDRVAEIGGAVPRDYIDYRFLTAEPLLELRVARRNGEEVVFEIEKDPDEDLGLAFTEDIFGGPPRIKTCGNHCLFCFVDRLPAGLRPALYLKDDDYRLSFLHGNFISLTNLTRGDLDRIAGQRLSPLYVSVHATEPELRASLMGSPRAARVLEDLAGLTRAGITVHTQVVVCPGINDGPHLERTLSDLAGLRPGVASVGVVPVGLTRFGPAEGPVRGLTRLEAEALLDQVLGGHERLGGFVYPADELFLATGRDLPPASFYGDFVQLQNGIGLGRMFLDDLERLERRLRRPAARGLTRPPGERFLAVTGRLARPLVAEAVRVVSAGTEFEGEVLEVANEFFGTAVTVAGLLAGEDILRAVREAGLGARAGEAEPAGTSGPVVVPGTALRAGSDQFLDGLTLGDLARETGRPFLAGGWLPRQMLGALRAWRRAGAPLGRRGRR